MTIATPRGAATDHDAPAGKLDLDGNGASGHSPALNKFAADLNAETIANMQHRHQKELSDLWRRLRKLQVRADYVDEVDETLMTTVVTLADGSHRTLHSLFEDAHTEAFLATRRLCTVCRDPKCAAIDPKECA